ncbi:hypothetical protein EsH8_I_000027 [Colletotrichum jinshuiense]
MTPIMRPKKTDIVRKRTGCQRCRSKKRQCDETRPECLACVQRGIPCSGYQSRIRFKDVSDRTAEMSKRVEAARWSALRSEDAARRHTSEESVQDSTATRNHLKENHTEKDKRQFLECGFGEATDHASPMAMLNQDDESLSTPQPDYRHIFDQSLSFLSNDIISNEDRPAGMSPSMSGILWPRPPLEVSNRVDNMSAMPVTSRRMIPSLATDPRDSLAIWNAHESDADAPPWDDMLDFPEPSRAQTPAAESTRPMRQRSLGLTEESLLEIFEKDVALRIALHLPFTDLFRASTGLRAAALALTIVYHHLCRTTDPQQPTCPGTQESADTGFHCHYYDFAVADLAHQLKCPNPEAADSLVCAAILLIYRDIAVGSHRDICGHLRQLETLSSVIDLASHCTPVLLRAWRLFSFDMRLRSLATRKSVAGPLPPQICTPWDSRLTIRDIFSSLSRLHGRAVMEASFLEPGSPSRQSASRRAVQWLCSVLGRRCDRRQWEQHDYHDESLSDDTIMAQCHMFQGRLDAWYRATAREDLPVPCLGTSAEGMVSGEQFGTIVPYDIPDRGAAIDFSLYLISRMTCLYLQSSHQPQDPKHAPVFASDALARVTLGIVLKIGPGQPATFGEPSVLTMLYMTVLLSEGAAIPTTVLEGILPIFKKGAFPAIERAEMIYMERLMELIVKERYRGRSIRFAIDSCDEDYRRDAKFASGRRRIVAFGDYGGRGHFRDVLYVGPEFPPDIHGDIDSST